MKSTHERSWTVAVLAPPLLAVATACGGTQSAPPALEGDVTAFVGVTVVPMDTERVVADQTVLVSGERIVEIGGSADIAVPAGAQRIEGAGLYLMPGLAEMHGHLPNPNTPQNVTENILFLYVANGVTTVRGMQGNPSQIELRERVRNGELVGPQLFLGSPAMSGNSVSTVEDAERLVREYDAAGFDLIKVQEGLAPEVYDAIATTANELGFPFGGHVSDNVGLFRALEAGQTTVDHLDNYVEALVRDDQDVEVEALVGVEALLDRVDESRIALVVEATLEAGTGVVPTMVLWESGILATRPSAELVEERTETRYMPAETVQQWVQSVDNRIEGSNLEARRKLAELRRRLLGALQDGGVPILLGTDSPQIFSVPGFSLHRELALYVEAGLTPYEVLQSGTRAVAEHLGVADDFGTVEIGKRADLLLLQGNPFEDVGNVARRTGVMANGRWISEEEIQQRLAEIAAEYAGPSSR